MRQKLLRSYEFTRGKFDDLYMYSLLKQDFEKSDKYQAVTLGGIFFFLKNSARELLRLIN